MDTTICTCVQPGFCSRHQCHKTPHWHMLCQTHAGYFRLWEEGRGPGQQRPSNPGGDAGRGDGGSAADLTPAGPGLLQRAANLGQAVVRHVADGLATVSPADLESRLAICRTCASCDMERMVCRERSCGCFLNVKAKWRSESCPLGKWPAVQAAESASTG